MLSDHTKRARVLCRVLLLLMMVLIFSFSARNADLSNGDSGRVGILIGHLFVPGFDQWPEAQQTAFSDNISYPVRKTAHMTEYAVLAVLAYGSLGGLAEGRRRFLYAELFAACYAATDEFHQLFVPGRACMLRDVGFDSLGACIGLLLLCLIFRACAARRGRKTR